jgi:hypothetical protein
VSGQLRYESLGISCEWLQRDRQSGGRRGEADALCFEGDSLRILETGKVVPEIQLTGFLRGDSFF